MNIEIRHMQVRRLAIIEHRGDPAQMGQTVNRLTHWAKAQNRNLKPKPGNAFGFGYDDPKTTKPEEFRFDLGLTVPETLALSNEVIERVLPAGRYAVAMHEGSRNRIDETIYAMYRDWLPESGERLGDMPCIFCYYNFDHEVAETELRTECWLLLED